MNVALVQQFICDCDRARPHCNQCLKSGWKCPQYGDSIERMFVHHIPENCDTNNVLKATSSSPGSCITRRARIDLQVNLSPPTADILGGRIVQSAESRAIDFFMSAHTFQNIGLIRGHYEYLSAFPIDVMAEERVVASLRAVALAAYATKFQHFVLLKKARQYYVSALRHINVALLSRREAAKYATIISILFLNTFEALTCESRDFPYQRETHLRGVASILEFRGVELVQSRRGLQLFRQTLLCISVTCLMRSFRIPMGLVKLHRHAAAYMDTGDPAWKLSDIMIALAYFRALVKDRTLCDPETIIASAKYIDRNLCSLADNMPKDWQFQVVELETTSEVVMGTQYHVYPDAWVAEIKRQLENVLDTHLFEAVQYQQSVIIMQQLVSDICASVPQYCGYIPDVVDGSPDTPQATSVADGLTSAYQSSNGIPATAGIYLLFWPLLSAGQMANSEKQRGWIIDRMRYIGETTGIQQAFVFEDILKRAVDPFQ
ncbi:hypothetical protein ASPNIDRAFT_43788 [Aspergillus niger ATCC 1015]|uniref:Uncharacterized protein n=1 Tax=Aspergillus niger (strain ATCC 1015 / CBS 113.46 / FGSC A1144 / LSHB Ac4 / NCTC 3858a / NRRL 328 / USDA 3528.7) TaxID=380704 RepID=G3XUH1_ASPNA|nr:hypothetical protein ASPNIDRAFT_43788 [Aspergillus niger ATCC 1015]